MKLVPIYRDMHDMDEQKLITSNNVEEDRRSVQESEYDIPSEFNNCPFEAELEKLPEVLHFITKLQNFARKQQMKLNKLRRKLREHKLERKTLQDASTQTESENMDEVEGAVWSGFQEIDTTKSIAEQVKEAAQNAMQQTGFVYEETSGMYYDYNTGYYYNAEHGLYYDGNSGTYYSYDDKTKVFQFHSQVEATFNVPPTRDSVISSCPRVDTKCEDDDESKRRHKLEESKENKKIKHERDYKHEPITCGTESLEEGECSNSSGEDETSTSEASSSHEMETEKDVSMGWPPCMRIIVTETNIEKLKVGTLFIITYTGGTLGREGDHAVSIPDINISKHHAKFTFSETSGRYYMIDFGSRNGTYLNGNRLSVAKQESDPHEVIHGSILQIGGTKLLCHIHAGRDTCGRCEPGLVQKKDAIDAEKAGTEDKKQMHKEELKRIRRKFGLDITESKAILAQGYEDRAQIRRSNVGSQDHHEKTQTASVEEPIQSDNIGFKILTKMGWSEGQALGKEGQGNMEPVPMVFHTDKAGLGSVSQNSPVEDLPSERKRTNWRKAQKRFKNIS